MRQNYWEDQRVKTEAINSTDVDVQVVDETETDILGQKLGAKTDMKWKG